jgi:hypothetical protein
VINTIRKENRLQLELTYTPPPQRCDANRFLLPLGRSSSSNCRKKNIIWKIHLLLYLSNTIFYRNFHFIHFHEMFLQLSFNFLWILNKRSCMKPKMLLQNRFCKVDEFWNKGLPWTASYPKIQTLKSNFYPLLI